MKTITLTLDEYLEDLKKAKSSAFISIEELQKQIRNYESILSSYSRVDHEKLLNGLRLFLKDIQKIKLEDFK